VDEDTKKEFEEIQSKSPLSSATGPASQRKDFTEKPTLRVIITKLTTKQSKTLISQVGWPENPLVLPVEAVEAEVAATRRDKATPTYLTPQSS